MRLLLFIAITFSAHAQNVTDIAHAYSEKDASHNDRAKDYTCVQHATKRFTISTAGRNP
jgi:hypothetical protein